tara:strand:+ start:4807 stop:5769 length:963 start_codon:yes stop_codon:yes gene_type:complete
MSESLKQLADSLNIATAQLSGDPRRLQLALGQVEERKRREEEEARRARLAEFAQTDPSLLNMFELFGERGLQQAFLQQNEETAKRQEEQRKFNLLTQAGLSVEDATLLTSGFSVSDLIDLKKSGQDNDEVFLSAIDKSVENTVEQVGFVEPFAQMDSAFGLGDAALETFNIAMRPLGFEPASVTGQASRGRDNLNLEIKTTLAQDFTGKVNQQLLNQIDTLLPKSGFTSEKDAQAKYALMRDRARTRIERLEELIRIGTATETQKARYADDLYRTKVLEKKLDAAVLSLEPKETTLEAKQETQNSSVSAPQIPYGSFYLD